MPFSSSLLSFKRKNEINIIENKPILKLPRALIKPFIKSGMKLKLKLLKKLELFNSFSMSRLELEKYRIISVYKFSRVFLTTQYLIGKGFDFVVL